MYLEVIFQNVFNTLINMREDKCLNLFKCVFIIAAIQNNEKYCDIF